MFIKYAFLEEEPNGMFASIEVKLVLNRFDIFINSEKSCLLKIASTIVSVITRVL